MNTQELIDYLALGEKDASQLIDEMNPKFKSRFLKAFKDLNKLIDEIRVKYPDANIYVEAGVPLLLIGSTHTSLSDNQEMEACCYYGIAQKIDGGGW